MQDPATLQQEILEANASKQAQYEALQQLQQAKLKALQDTIGNYGNFRYIDFGDFIDPDNQNWNDYKYKIPGDLVEKRQGYLSQAIRQGRVGAGSPVGMFIQHIRDAKNTDDIKKQLELWNLYKPLDLPSNGNDYVKYFTHGFGGYQGSNAPYGGSRPIFPTTDGSNPVQTSTSGTQGVQAGAGVVKGGIQGSTGAGGTYASSRVARGGTKTIGYDPNPGNVSLAYVMRNAPEQERRAALINKWNRENGRESVPYVPGTEIPAGSLNRSGSTYATPGMSTGGTYATGEGIKDANGNVLTNPGGDWEYQYALKDPQYGLGMMGKMSDAQKNYLQAASDNMGYKYNFTGATRFV